MTETTETKDKLQESSEVLKKDITDYMKLQTAELSDSFELMYQLNQAAIGKYTELIDEAGTLTERANTLSEQESSVSSFLSNLSLIEQDIGKLENTIGKLEDYCTLLEKKLGRS